MTTSRRLRLSFSLALAALLAIALAAMPAPGQTPAQTKSAVQPAPAQQAFEAASIRLIDPNAPEPDTPPQRQQFPANRLTMHYASLAYLICMAYGVDWHRTTGWPDWINTERYDFNAKVEGDMLLTQEQMQPLLQNLLQERFHVKVHHEHKIVPGYALVIAKGGPKLQPNKGAPFHGMIGNSEIRFWNESIKSFALIFETPVERPIVDRTGLEGTYDLDLNFAPEDTPSNPADSKLPDIFTALHEQLGLKLVPQKVPIDFLVIDHADKIPTEN